MQPLPPSGLQKLPHLSWGSHLAHFFNSVDELGGLLVPYFRAGLDNGEQCLWVTCDPLGAEQARSALRAEVPDLDARERGGQIAIVNDSAFYSPDERLKPRDLVDGLVQREQEAIGRGFAGFRATGNCSRAARAHRADFLAYERLLHEACRGRRMICLCSYCIDHLDDAFPIELMECHDLAVAGGAKAAPAAAPEAARDEQLLPLDWAQQKRTYDLAMAASRMGIWRYSLSDRICVYDANAQQLYGLSGPTYLHDEEGVKAMIHADDIELMWSRVAKAIDPQGDGRYDMEYRVRQSDGSWRWLSAWGLAEFEGEGPSRRAIAIAGASQDLTDPKETEALQRLRLEQLNQRLKSTLATIQGITSGKPRPSGDLLSARMVLDARIAALNKANDLLRASPVGGVGLGEIVARALDGFPADQLSLSGPRVTVSPRHTLALSMALHELASNAARFGALSDPAGRVTVSWEVRDGQLDLDWRESGGPPVVPPARKGYGSRLMEQLLVGDLGGELKIDYHANGLRFCMTASV